MSLSASYKLIRYWFCINDSRTHIFTPTQCRFAIAPFDVVKIRLQLQSQRQHLQLPFLRQVMPGSVKYNGLVHGLKVIAAEEGIRVSSAKSSMGIFVTWVDQLLRHRVSTKET
jgi:hypothetical protein